MKSQERFFVKNLLLWFEKNKRDFPWRIDEGTNPYHILVAELMLKKTRADNVSTVFKKFINTYPTPNSILTASDEDIEAMLQPLGLINQRKRAFIKIFTIIRDNYDGKIPSHKKELLELPYVGDYTVNTILCFGYDKRVPIVDVNVTRICQRYFELDVYGDPRVDTHIWDLLKDIIPRKRFKEFNLALLDFGAIICTSHNPKCPDCLINKECLFYKKDGF